MIETIVTFATFFAIVAIAIVLTWLATRLFTLPTRCEHEWLEVSRTFVEPTNMAHWLESSERAKHITGFTTILFTCKRCNAFHKEELQGHVHQPKVVPLHRVKP